ncbi:MAG: tetratricopeptide repeat protein [Thermotogota bacterium]
MKKFFIITLIISLTIISFSSIFEDTFKKALNYSWEGEYTKAEEIFKDLMESYRTVDVVIAYSNMLAWQEKYQQALEILYKYEEENNDIKANKAKVYYWMGNYSKAYEFYTELKNDNYTLEEEFKDFYTWYENTIIPYGSFSAVIKEVENEINAGNEDKAEELLSRLSEYFVNDKRISLKMSELFAEKGDYSSAVGYLEAIEPKDCEIYVRMFELNYESKNYDDAYQNYMDLQETCTNKIDFSEEKKNFVKWYEEFMKDYENYETAFAKANDFARNEEYAKAEKIYQDLLKYFNTEELILAYTNVLGWQEKYQLAILFLNSKKEMSLDIKAQLGKMYEYASNYEKAYYVYLELKENGYELSEEQNEFIRLYEKYYLD